MHDHLSYKGPRPDIASYVKDPLNVLDVGCNNGAFAAALKLRSPHVKVWGMDINPAALGSALQFLENGWVIDLDDLDRLKEVLNDLSFDHIIAGDVLEHTNSYQKITGVLYDHLRPGGRLIISVPNYGHWHLMWVFLTGKWQRNARGIFDRTHKTVIMRGNLKEFMHLCPAGEFKLLKRNFRFFETNRFWKLNMIITYACFPLLLLPYIRDWFTHGYIFSITKPISPK